MKFGQLRYRHGPPSKTGHCGFGVSLNVLILFALISAGRGEASGCETAREWPSLIQRVSETVARKDWSRLQQLSGKLAQLCPTSPKGHYWQGAALFNSGHFFAAVRSLRKSLQIQPTGRAHLALAQAYAELDQKMFAREEFQRAKSLAPANPAVHYVEGKYFYQKEHRLDLAEKALRRALELRPDHIPSLCYLALCLSAIERKVEAEQALLRAVRIAPEQGDPDALAHELLAELYIEMQQPEKANPHASRAVEINPDSTKSQFLLGKTQWMLKHPEGAIVALEKAIALDESYAAPRYLLGQVLLAIGQHQRAKQELTSFREIEKLYGRAR